MPNPRPRLFVASSTEGRLIAEPVAGILQDVGVPKLWLFGTFQPGNYALPDLVAELRRSDFVIVVGTPDDVVDKRGTPSPAVRDNLLVEYGIAAGALGTDRAFWIVPPSVQKGMPTDLSGINLVMYREDVPTLDPGQRLTAINNACLDLKESINRRWERVCGERRDAEVALARGAAGMALRRLHGAVAQLRDLLIVLQHDVLDGLKDRERFERAKEQGRGRVVLLAELWAEDAARAEVSGELDQLVAATQDAITALPYPGDVFPAQEELIGTGWQLARSAFEAARGGGNPIPDVEARVGAEIAARFERLKDLYHRWWVDSERRITAATSRLTDALMNSGIRLLLTDATANGTLR